LNTDNNLKEVKDKVTIFNLLSGAKENDSDVFVWRLIGHKKHLGKMRIESLRKSDNVLCLIPLEDDEAIIKEIVGNLGHVDLYIPDCAMLLRCDLKSTDRGLRYYLKIPILVVQLERRQVLRLTISDPNSLQVNFSKSSQRSVGGPQHFSKPCVDLSSGGISFFVSKLELKYFQIGDEISEVKLKFEKWSIQLALQVCSILEISPDEYNKLPYRVWRINCKFNSIDQVSKKYLERYIFERINQELRVINEV
jgi:hypothetical protein